MDTFSSSPEGERFRSLLQQLTDFAVRYEDLEKQLEARSGEVETLLLESGKNIASYLEQIQKILKDYEGMMSETGAARFRLNAEKILKDGQEHQLQLQSLSQKLIEKMNQSTESFNEQAHTAVQHFSEELEGIDLRQFKETAQQAYTLLEDMSKEVISRVQKATRGFLIKNLLGMGAIAIIIVVFLGQYTTNEWPWDAHQRATQERAIGNDILEDWGTMDEGVKRYLIEHVFSDGVLK
ncbi:MAG: hypothetical protein HY939_02395 [Gammaproteobacteria bacterium]|nr:hypothetical protein [Gammaproteobacteria bacterium]